MEISQGVEEYLLEEATTGWEQFGGLVSKSLLQVTDERSLNKAFSWVTPSSIGGQEADFENGFVSGESDRGQVSRFLFDWTDRGSSPGCILLEELLAEPGELPASRFGSLTEYRSNVLYAYLDSSSGLEQIERAGWAQYGYPGITVAIAGIDARKAIAEVAPLSDEAFVDFVVDHAAFYVLKAWDAEAHIVVPATPDFDARAFA